MYLTGVMCCACVRRRIAARYQGAPIAFPPHWTSMVRDLIEGLLHPDPSLRYGVRGGVQRIKDHPWFTVRHACTHIHIRFIRFNLCVYMTHAYCVH